MLSICGWIYIEGKNCYNTCVTVWDCKRIDLVIMSANNLRLATPRCGLKLSTSLKTAMADTTRHSPYIAMKSIKCLGRKTETKDSD